MENQHVGNGGDVTPSFLPEDLVFAEILTRLPVKSLMRFNRVSKSWKTRISGDSSFIDAHRRQQQTGNTIVPWLPENDRNGLSEQRITVISEHCSKQTDVDVSYLMIKKYDIVRIVDSCNGLVCLRGGSPKQIMLWNPATRKLRKLPLPPNYRHWNSGFGLDNTSGEYKVVSLSLEKDGSTDLRFVRARVFSRSGNAWRDCKASSRITGTTNEVGVAVDGAVHWEFTEEYVTRILTFDLSDEVLRLNDGPSGDVAELGRWRSSLAVLVYTGDYVSELWHLYVAVTSSGGGLRWSKILKFTRIVEKDFTTVRIKQLFMMRNIGKCEMFGLADPGTLGVARNPRESATSTIIDPLGAYDYVETIVSVF